MAPKECNLEADIESGQIFSEGKRVLLTRTNSGLRVQGSQESSSFVPKSGNPSFGNVTVAIDKNPRIEYRDLLSFLEKGFLKETISKPNSTKNFKPPRPPKGPFLYQSDMKLVKELSELAAKKRARIERVRALKKMKAAKSLSSGSSATAMAVTILFFFVIVFQGVMGS